MVDKRVSQADLEVFDRSLARLSSILTFLDRFYDRFLDSSPKVREKFANTDFIRQKRALRTSFHLMLMAAEDERGPERYLKDLAQRHDSRHLGIGAEYYDLWLDSLLATVRECDPQFTPEVERAWERVMMVGIDYMLANY